MEKHGPEPRISKGKTTTRSHHSNLISDTKWYLTVSLFLRHREGIAYYAWGRPPNADVVDRNSDAAMHFGPQRCSSLHPGSHSCTVRPYLEGLTEITLLESFFGCPNVIAIGSTTEDLISRQRLLPISRCLEGCTYESVTAACCHSCFY